MSEIHLESFENSIGIGFLNKMLLKTAFVHRSAVNENKHLKEHNERLEFLGDAVLELSVTEFLYTQFTNKPEGELTNLRSAIVKRETLAEVASDLGVGQYLFLSKGEKNSGGDKKDYILANTIEAIIGAIYLDQGWEMADAFIKRYIIIKLENILKQKSYIDHKTLFQEKSQEHLGITPKYKLISEEGPDHAKTFTMGAFLGEEYIAEGKSNSKQSAEQIAASNALTVKKWNL